MQQTKRGRRYAQKTEAGYNCSHGCSYNDTVLNIKNESNWCIYSKRMTEVTIAMLSELSEDDILLIASNVLK